MADLADRAALEAEFERQIGRLTADQRRRLAELLGDPPDITRVPEDFWRQMELERRERLALLLLVLFLAGARTHGIGRDEESAPRGAAGGGGAVGVGGFASGGTGGAGETTLSQRQPAPGSRDALAAGELWARQRAAEVARDYVTVSRERLVVRAEEWRQKRLAGEEPTAADGKRAAAEVLSPERDQTAAITETTNAGASGAEWAMKARGLSSAEDLWITEDDEKVCPVCEPLNRQPRPQWEGLFPQGPPAHPRCRCFIQYAAERRGAVAAA